MHPEALGGRNTLISSDFVHYFRRAIEDGLDGPQAFEGFGGVCIFFAGPLGGLMTQLGLPITDRHGNTHKDNGVGKAKAQGENLALLAAKALRSETSRIMKDQRVAVCAKTFYAPIGWPFKAALYLGIVHPGVYGGKAKSEIDAIRIGEIEMLTTPGELFPEIAYGGIENPEGADFTVAPVETPPLTAAMNGAPKMNINLCNDEIGYIVPKSQWDQKAPFAYGLTSPPYGEVYTGEPEIAPVIHRTSLDVLEELHHALGETAEAGYVIHEGTENAQETAAAAEEPANLLEDSAQ